MDITDIVLAVALAGTIAAVAVLMVRRGGNAQLAGAEARTLADKIIANAEREADVLRRAVELEVKDQRLEAKAAIDAEARERRDTTETRERELRDQERQLARDREQAAQQTATLTAQQVELGTRASQVETEVRRLTRELERVAGLSTDAAKQELMERLERDARFEAGRMLQRVREEAEATAEDHARHVISSAIQRIAGDYVMESTISAVNLPSDDMKGRIIGREGRNIRALEAATGVNLIVDDTPETILLSSFDPLRRKVAHETLERLMADGRFHPTRIEETVAKVEARLDKEMRDDANKVVYELDIHDLHPDIIGLLGRLKYRLSYGQNNLSHAREVALICGMMAGELGLNRKLATRSGLLHDIGKSLTHEVQGGHALIGAEFAERCGEHPHVVNAIAAHHGDVAPLTKEAYLVAAGDALSAGRPGARRESMELYVKRLADLEGVASAFPGVDRVYAMQAGREVRVLVDADTLSDEECAVISRDIAKRIEQEVTYPGQVKVCLVRESRFIEYAR
ncbi:MAG: ribonuclease Y [Nitrospirae bacterium]|nr:ribonuclease Y [Nitrospirota bacterium]